MLLLLNYPMFTKEKQIKINTTGDVLGWEIGLQFEHT